MSKPNPDGYHQADKAFRRALMLELAAVGPDDRGLRNVARALIRSATSGYLPAITEVANRVDGKATQLISGDPNAPLLVHAITRVIVDAANDCRELRQISNGCDSDVAPVIDPPTHTRLNVAPAVEAATREMGTAEEYLGNTPAKDAP